MSRPEHPVFRGPVPVTLNVEQAPPPEHFRRWSLDELPETIPTLAILKRHHGPDVATPEGEDEPVPGLVSSGEGFEDTPDAEHIAGGIHTKGPSYASIARQGRILQWGFAGTPDDMTDAGRAIFLNALDHVMKHADDPIVGFRQAESRDGVAVTLALVDGMEPERVQTMLARTFGANVPAEAWGDRVARRAWFATARPHLWFDRSTETFSIDEDARAMGFANDDVALLRRAIDDLDAPDGAERARRVLERYTNRRFAAAGDWRSWLDESAPRLFFSDVAGYRFMVRGELGDRLPPDMAGAEHDSWSAVQLDLEASRRDGIIYARLVMSIAPGFHVHAPSTKDRSVVPLSLELASARPDDWIRPPVIPTPSSGTISGSFALDFRVRQPEGDLALTISYQACTEKICLRPVRRQRLTASLDGI